MKKILVAGAIALVAFVSQAAAVNWQINNIQPSPTTAASTGWLVQIYDASTAYSFDAAKGGSIAALGSSTSTSSGTIYKASGSFGNYAGGTEVSIYAVIYDAASIADAKNYVVSSALTKTVNAAGSDLSMSFGNMASTATTNMFRNASWSAAAVPEPTSGLLILLGMAGLALRRRRA